MFLVFFLRKQLSFLRAVSMQCNSCQVKTTRQFPICLNCVCSVPNCENIGLFHSRCFKHWLEFNPNWLPNRCIDPNCWQCNTQSKFVSLRNYEELQYCYQIVKKRTNLFFYPHLECIEQLVNRMKTSLIEIKKNIDKADVEEVE